MKSDIEICREAKKLNIKDIASKLGIEDKIELYGSDKAKIKYNEIPDYIWKIIQDQLYENAKKVQQEELDSAEASLTKHKKDFDDFSKLTLKE